MRTILSLCTLIFYCQLGMAQSFNSDFQDGTLQNWTNTDGTTTTMSVEDGDDGVSKHLKKVSDGSNGATGELAIKNVIDYNGNYDCDDPSGINCLGWVEIYLKNENSFDINLRMGVVGANGTKLVSNVANQSLNYPEGSQWFFYDIALDPSQFTVVEGSGTISETLQDVVEMRLIQNEELSFEGVYASGNMIIDNIFYIFLLSSNDNPLTNVSLYPNPATHTLHIKFPTITASDIEIYDLSGKRVQAQTGTTNIAAVDLSRLSNGIYFAKISTNGGTTLKKFLKK